LVALAYSSQFISRTIPRGPFESFASHIIRKWKCFSFGAKKREIVGQFPGKNQKYPVCGESFGVL